MAKVEDKNGFWFIEHNPITKTGVYDYLGKQISPECEPNKIYKVLRPKEELFKKETLDSLRLIPIVNDHTMIGTGFTAPEDKGLDGTLGDNVSHDTDTIYNDLKIISNKMKEEIQNGKKELSLGYFCRYDKQPGTYKGQRYDYVQRDIIANHLALVDKGRMGADVRVYDSKNIPEGEAFAMDSIDIAIDKDEDIEWITVRGTHVPIKKGATAEQKTKTIENFFKMKRATNKEDVDVFENEEKRKKFEELNAELHGKSKAEPEKSEWDKERDKENERHEKLMKKLKKEIEEATDPQEIRDLREHRNGMIKEHNRILDQIFEDEEKSQKAGNSEPERKEQNPFEKTLSKSGFKKDDNDYSYTKEYADGTTISVHSEKNDDSGKFYIADIVDKNGNMSQKEYHYQGIEDVFNKLNKEYEKSEPEQAGKISQKEKRMFKNGYTYSGEPEQKALIEEDIRNDKYSMAYETRELQWRIKKLNREIKKEQNEIKPDYSRIYTLKRQITDEENKHKKNMQKYKERIAELEAAHKEWYGQDSMEYKTIQGEGKMADKKEKVAIDEDKRKIIDEIGGILKGKVDEELWKTVIGKAEKLAYNASEAGKGTDEGEEVEEVIEEKEEKAGKDCGKKAAKDKCGKDKDEEEVEEKEDVVNKVVEKKGMDENDVIKVIARKDRLAKAVAKVIGTFDHSEMTEQQVAEYACDKLDLPVKKGEEITGINCYLKSLPKERVIFSYGMDSASKEDAEFEKFQNKGE